MGAPEIAAPTSSSVIPHKTPPVITDDRVEFAIADPDEALEQVVLHQEIRRPRNGPPFTLDSGDHVWRLQWARPDADRVEYQFELIHKDGGTELICDPSNTNRAPGAFGDKSVIEFPGYRCPEWVGAETTPAAVETFEIRSRTLRTKVPVELWSSQGADEAHPLPLLLAHDGPEYRKYSGLLHFLEVMTRAGELPPMRAALIQPWGRDEIYSASATYSRVLAHELIPAIIEKAPVPHGRSMRVGMGASLGGLAMLHVHRRYPATFGGLYLQSGSFFRMRYDKQESGFPRFRRISRFVGQVLTGDDWSHPVPTTMTCGTVEENLVNNRAVKDALVRQGYDVGWEENRDAHNWIAWRDTFDPHLLQLLQKVWT